MRIRVARHTHHLRIIACVCDIAKEDRDRFARFARWREMAKKDHDRAYHVVAHDDCWWVENDTGESRHSSRDEHDAVRWALDAAHHDHARGLDVIVCVEQPDGSFKLAWQSP